MPKTHIILVVILFLLFNTFLSAQNVSTFVILEKENIGDILLYTEALNMADMNNYRLAEKRVKISFTSGVVAELFSARELSEMGINIKGLDFRKDFEHGFQLPEFSLSENGYIIALYKVRTKK